MNKKNLRKLAITAFCVFLATFITDFFIHGMILKGIYQETAYLWRPEEVMPQYMSWMLMGQLLVGVFFAWIFTHGYKGKGWKEGARFGVYLGGFQMGQQFIMYAVAPYPLVLVANWVILGFLQAIVVGIVAALVYSKV